MQTLLFIEVSRPRALKTSVFETRFRLLAVTLDTVETRRRRPTLDTWLQLEISISLRLYGHRCMIYRPGTVRTFQPKEINT